MIELFRGILAVLAPLLLLAPEEAEAAGERGAAGCLMVLDDDDLLLDLPAVVVCDLLVLILSFNIALQN